VISWTLANILMITSLRRSIMYNISSFCFSSVPQPRFPLRRLDNPRRPFFTAFCVLLLAKPHRILLPQLIVLHL